MKMKNIDITEILKDMAAGRKNLLGDYWHISHCQQAADEIIRLRDEIQGMHEDAAGESI